VIGDEALTIKLNMRISGWNEFAAQLMSTGVTEDSEQLSFAECMGLSSEEAATSLLGSDFTAIASITGSGSSVSGSMELTAPAPLDSAAIQSMSANMAKSDQTTTFSGSVTLSDASAFVSCLMKDYIPGEYSITGLQYSFSGSIEGATQTLDGTFTSLAQKSNNKWKVTFPSSATPDMNITINTPSGMSILSVLGGQKASDHSATSTPGEEFTVTYGQAGTDMTIWIIAAVVVVALVFLLTRKKKK